MEPSSSALNLLGAGEGGGNMASFSIQANALLRKNITFQKRNIKTNIGIVAYPILICLLLASRQSIFDKSFDSPDFKCGCECVPVKGSSTCKEMCGPQYSSLTQFINCLIANPLEWPALMQVPLPQYRAARDVSFPSADLPNSSCRLSGTCSVTVLFTGQNQTLAETLSESLFPVVNMSADFSDYLALFSQVVTGSDTKTRDTQYFETAFIVERPIYYIQPSCLANSSLEFTIDYQGVPFPVVLVCVPGLVLWRNSSSMINDELFRGYLESNAERKSNEFLTAYDL